MINYDNHAAHTITDYVYCKSFLPSDFISSTCSSPGNEGLLNLDLDIAHTINSIIVAIGLSVINYLLVTSS